MFSRLTFLFALLISSVLANAADRGIEVVSKLKTPQVEYAKHRLEEPLAFSSVARFQRKLPPSGRIELAIDPKLGAEAFRITARKGRALIIGGDARGLIYGALEARRQLHDEVPLDKLSGRGDTPRLAFRGIKLNTPWDSYRPSSALQQHAATMHDLGFWRAYLDMMVENRFNSFSLWTMHPFTYMIRPKHFPEASKWTDAQFAEWRHLYREIFRMAKERGLDTYVVFWSIFVSEEFEKAHNPAQKNYYPHYYVEGDTSDVTKRYLRESVTQMLVEYPDVDGIGVSHGEGMAGMTPSQRQKFVDEVYIAGALEANKSRPVKLIHRVPFSSGLDSGPGVSTDVEKLTRTAMENLGNRFSGPIWVEMKFNWSHGHSTPKLVKVHGGKLGDTYFKPTPTNYRIVWQVRNEDFFALRWGDADFIRAHIAENGRADHVGGYFVGSETYIPALDYFTSSQDPVNWEWAFQRQWLFYELWGRLLYDPATPDTVFAADFQRRYGDKASPLMRAYSLASEVPLTLAKIYDSKWDFTLYSEGFLALQGEVTKYIGIDALIDQPTLDPDYLSIKEFVPGGRAAPGKISPLMTADFLDARVKEALQAVKDIDTSGNASLMYEVADVRIWSNLGAHLAEKLRGGVELQTYRTLGGESHKRAAIEHLTKALGFWDEVVRISRPIYNDMPLTHYNHNSFDANPQNLFHWALLRDQVAKDVETARNATPPKAP
ncbi:MAG TPA: hypothetical protein VM146_01070 [Steroidobacteraceae bacterium]|nr:hypothetical protein [Steroidobacteraceae bacterium]